MKISKIRVQNYKLLRDVCFEINPDMNVFVGENDAGKSTLLEVISIISSGKLNGYQGQVPVSFLLVFSFSLSGCLGFPENHL